MEKLNLKDVSSDAQRMYDDAQERISEFYETSSDFVRENPTASLIGAGIFVGLVGFFLGRFSRSE